MPTAAAPTAAPPAGRASLHKPIVRAATELLLDDPSERETLLWKKIAALLPTYYANLVRRYVPEREGAQEFELLQERLDYLARLRAIPAQTAESVKALLIAPPQRAPVHFGEKMLQAAEALQFDMDDIQPRLWPALAGILGEACSRLIEWDVPEDTGTLQQVLDARLDKLQERNLIKEKEAKDIKRLLGTLEEVFE